MYLDLCLTRSLVGARGEVASAAGEPGTLFVSRDLDFMDGNNSASGRDVTAGA